ncbi:MAG: hypothetical protein GF313_13360 [Caldithrix sp.]|nr:hypothetical protein [Caldithrix sp.]
MEGYPYFFNISVNDNMRNLAYKHAKLRCQRIKRQFIPRHAPLSHEESNFVGVLGELAVQWLIFGKINLESQYGALQTDDGDIAIADKSYDIKTEAVPSRFYEKLVTGKIKPYEPYGCRVWTARHRHHLDKYTGGIIFTALPIPNDSRMDKQFKTIRPRIVNCATEVIVMGFASPGAVAEKEPTEYSPPHPVTGKQRRYNSPNYIFHHSELDSLKELIIFKHHSAKEH